MKSPSPISCGNQGQHDFQQEETNEPMCSLCTKDPKKGHCWNKKCSRYSVPNEPRQWQEEYKQIERQVLSFKTVGGVLNEAIKAFISRILKEEKGRTVKKLENMFKGHGIKLPNHPHNDDISFFSHTPTGIYNQAIQDVITRLTSEDK